MSLILLVGTEGIGGALKYFSPLPQLIALQVPPVSLCSIKIELVLVRARAKMDQLLNSQGLFR